MTSTVRLALSVVLVVSVFFPRVAGAAAEGSAQEHYEKGTTLFDLGKYLDAAHEYEAAFSVKSDAALLFNIGQAYRLGGDSAAAIRAYRSYLRRVPAADNRQEVERWIDLLRSTTQPKPSEPPPKVDNSPRAPEPPPVMTFTPVAQVSRRPIYKRWWPWTIGAVVVLGGAVGLTLALTIPKNANAPGAVPINFP